MSESNDISEKNIFLKDRSNGQNMDYDVYIDRRGMQRTKIGSLSYCTREDFWQFYMEQYASISEYELEALTDVIKKRLI